MQYQCTGFKLSAVLGAALLLSACGGGSSGPASYTITASNSVGGSISPQTITVTSGNTASLTVLPDEGYEIVSVSGCGGALSGANYITGVINGNCAVSAQFKKIVYTITHTIERNGIEWEQVSLVEHGNAFSVPISELTWYDNELSGSCPGEVVESNYTIASVKASCALTQRYVLQYSPEQIKPALGFSRSEYRFKAGESRDIALLAESFGRDAVKFSVEQSSGPEIVFNVKDNVLTLLAPEVESATPFTFNVSATVPLGVGTAATATQVLTVYVHPLSQGEVTLLQGSSDGSGVNLMITGDGFTSQEQDKQLKEAMSFFDVFFKEPTIAVHRDFWNIHFAPAVSVESGAVNGAEGHSTRDTAFGSYFNCSGIDRLLCTDVRKVLNFALQRVPQYDQILLMVNDAKYGGAGYWGAAIGTFSLSPQANQVAIHELGHSFSLLADEYDYGTCSTEQEPSSINVTTQAVASDAKWKYWYSDVNNIPTGNNFNTPSDTIGHFEGGNYCAFGIWRATFNSLMRSNGMPFGKVNAEQWALSVYRDAGVMRGQFPLMNEISVTNERGSAFSVDVYADPKVQQVTWFFNDSPLARDLVVGNTLFVPPQATDFTIKAVIEDVSGIIKNDPNGLSSKTVEWRVSVTN